MSECVCVCLSGIIWLFSYGDEDDIKKNTEKE